MGDVAKVALVGATPGRLDTVDRHVSVFTEEIASRKGESFHRAEGLLLIERFEASFLIIFDQSLPDVLRLANHHRICIFLGFEGKARGMRSTHDYRDPPLTKPLRDLVSPRSMHHHSGHTDQIDILFKVNRLYILVGDPHLDLWRGERSQRGQGKASKPDVLNHLL
jgi:hypothetical protein